MKEPRLISGPDAAAYLGLTAAAFAKWVAQGIIPKPLPGTRRWDRKAIDLTLDKASNLVAPSVTPDDDNSFETWKRKYEARKEAEWEQKYEARKTTEARR